MMSHDHDNGITSVVVLMEVEVVLKGRVNSVTLRKRPS